MKMIGGVAGREVLFAHAHQRCARRSVSHAKKSICGHILRPVINPSIYG